jgi:dihydrofolate reductase
MGTIVFDISMSLDGFISGANVSPEAGLGDDGERLHDWGFNSSDPYNLKIVEEWIKTGAIISGRTTYDHSIMHWGDGGPIPSARVPVIVVSHSVPDDVPADSVYTFVDNIEAAYELANQVAGDRMIGIQGSTLARQFLTRGLIDEISIHLVPVLFGSGTRLFEGLGEHITLEAIDVVKTAAATHLSYRVVKG